MSVDGVINPFMYAMVFSLEAVLFNVTVEPVYTYIPVYTYNIDTGCFLN